MTATMKTPPFTSTWTRKKRTQKKRWVCFLTSRSHVPPAHNLTVVAKLTWRSPVYSFFKDNIVIKYDKGQHYHFFPCAAHICKAEFGGVRRYQDKKDCQSTSNLKKHAVRCFGEDAVKQAMEGQAIKDTSGSVFESFARHGQQPVTVSNWSLTNPEARAHMVKWITESNRPANILTDREFISMLTASRPHITVPSPSTIT